MSADKENSFGINDLSRLFNKRICIECGGTGTVFGTGNKEICMRCDGSGYTCPLNKTGEVKIDIQT